MILGFILGGMMEENLRRALDIYDGYAFLWERPLTLGIMLVTLVVMVMPLIAKLNLRRGTQAGGEGG